MSEQQKLEKQFNKISLDKKPKSSSENKCLYTAERVIGNGSFGIVYEASVIKNGKIVAIKKVLQDRRYKNRELKITKMLSHPNIVVLNDYFYCKGDKKDEIYLNLVMEYIPETLYQVTRKSYKQKRQIAMMYIKSYLFQMCRALAYLHSLGICHRDIKPQNLLVDTKTHIVKLCDFGSAKILRKGEANVSYICSRYYRAPELILDATDYTLAIDVWSLGCVFAELLIGTPLFQGSTGVDQLVEIIKVLGVPKQSEIDSMNITLKNLNFPNISTISWETVFGEKASEEAIDLLSKFLVYNPDDRLRPFQALTHHFFDDLRKPNAKLPNGDIASFLFEFTNDELLIAESLGIKDKIVPINTQKDIKLN